MAKVKADSDKLLSLGGQALACFRSAARGCKPQAAKLKNGDQFSVKLEVRARLNFELSKVSKVDAPDAEDGLPGQ